MPPFKFGLKHQLPAAGVREDFEELLQRFTASETVRYEKFSEIWREMKMPLIFAGRQSEKEVREFTEECLKIAVQYAMSPYNFQVRVGALYLLYGIINTQPCLYRATIRMTPDMWHDLIEFQNEAHRQQHLDVDYIFHKLRLQNAFSFVANINEVAHFRDLTEEEVSLPDEFKEEQSALFDIFSSDSLEQVATVHQHYHKFKVALEGPGAKDPSKSLSVIKPELISNITKAIGTYQERRKGLHGYSKRRQGQVTDDDDEDEEEESDENDPSYAPQESTSKKSRLKAKAYESAVKETRSRRGGKRRGHQDPLTEESEQDEGETETRSMRGGKKAGQDSLTEESEQDEGEEETKEDPQNDDAAPDNEDTEAAEEHVLSMPVVEGETSKLKKGKGKGGKPVAQLNATISPVKKHKTDSKRKSPLKDVLPKTKRGKKKKS